MYPDDQVVDAIEDGDQEKIIVAVKKGSLNLGPAMLWASWKETNYSSEVINTLIELGGKPNQVLVKT